MGLAASRETRQTALLAALRLSTPSDMIGQSLRTLEEKRHNPTMPKNQIFPALAVALVLPLWALAQVPPPSPASAPVPEGPPTEAETLIDEAIKKLQALQSVSADMEEEVSMLGQQFRLKGRYLKAPNHRVYLQLNLTGPGENDGSLLQVCDGTTLWEYMKVLDSPNYSKLLVQPVFEKLNNPDVDAALREQIINQLGFAGPDTLLSGLRKAIVFDQKEEGEFEGTPVWILRGRWKDRNALSSPGQPPLPPTGPLPPYVPSLATVWVGKENGWPYQLRLEGRALSLMERGKTEAPPSDEAEDNSPSSIRLTYSNVKINVDLGAENFAFTPPPGVQVDDRTPGITTGLDNALNEQAALRKAQAAAEGDGSVDLPVSSIPAPSPAPAEDSPPSATPTP